MGYVVIAWALGGVNISVNEIIPLRVIILVTWTEITFFMWSPSGGIIPLAGGRVISRSYSLGSNNSIDIYSLGRISILNRIPLGGTIGWIPQEIVAGRVFLTIGCRIDFGYGQNLQRTQIESYMCAFKETNLYQEQPTHSRCLSYKERNKSIIITETPSDQTPVLSPQPPSPPCTKPPEDNNNCPTLDINDTKTFTDYYSFPPITLIDDLEVWDEEEEEEEENI